MKIVIITEEYPLVRSSGEILLGDALRFLEKNSRRSMQQPI